MPLTTKRPVAGISEVLVSATCCATGISSRPFRYGRLAFTAMAVNRAISSHAHAEARNCGQFVASIINGHQPTGRSRTEPTRDNPRFTQLLPPELTSLSLAEKRPPLAYSPTGCENPPRGDWVPRKVQQIPDYFTPCGFVVRAFLLVPKSQVNSYQQGSLSIRMVCFGGCANPLVLSHMGTVGASSACIADST